MVNEHVYVLKSYDPQYKDVEVGTILVGWGWAEGITLKVTGVAFEDGEYIFEAEEVSSEIP